MKNSTSLHNHSLKYRADIDGLRALAIIVVLIFHFFPNILKSGFIGVDIFFVISGYLISTIILKEIKNNSFEFKTFYYRRIKRIFPSLVVVIIFSLIMGYFVLYADEYQQLAKHTIGASTFSNNILLLRESGYFDNASDTKPLLHLWSLGIEEQFYIIWPIILLLIWKKKYSLIYISIILLVLSFLLNIYFVDTNSSATFFLPITRAWELMIGFIIAYLLYIEKDYVINFREKYYNIISLFGIILLIIGFVIITKDKLFPGWLAMLPTIGIALIIFSSEKSWVNKYILSSKILVMIGLISYPLYLWHYPLLVFARIITNDTASTVLKLFVLFLSFLFAWITYKFIEKPIRLKNKNSVLFLILSMLLLGLSGLYIYINKGMQDRSFVQNNLNIKSGNDGGSDANLIRKCGISYDGTVLVYDKPFRLCFKDSRSNVKYALIGDSKASALYDGLVRTSNNKGRWLGIGGNSTKGDINSNLKVSKLYNMAVDSILLNNDIKTVVLASAAFKLFELKTIEHIENLPLSKSYDIAKEGLSLFVKKILLSGKKVVLVIDNPTLKEPRDCIVRTSRIQFLEDDKSSELSSTCQISIQKHLKLSKQYLDLLSDIKNINPAKIKVFDTLDYLCDKKDGLCRISKNGRMLYSYSNYISDYAAGLIGTDLNKFLATF